MVTVSEAKPCLELRLSFMVGHRLWSLRGIVLRRYQLHQVFRKDLSLDQSSSWFILMTCKVKSQVRLFADDTAAYLAITKPAESKQLQDDLDTLQEWELDWNMEFNPGKCQVTFVLQD